MGTVVVRENVVHDDVLAVEFPYSYESTPGSPSF